MRRLFLLSRGYGNEHTMGKNISKDYSAKCCKDTTNQSCRKHESGRWTIQIDLKKWFFRQQFPPLRFHSNSSCFTWSTRRSDTTKLRAHRMIEGTERLDAKTERTMPQFIYGACSSKSQLPIHSTLN